jgi:hypothetical protein
MIYQTHRCYTYKYRFDDIRDYNAFENNFILDCHEIILKPISYVPSALSINHSEDAI